MLLGLAACGEYTVPAAHAASARSAIAQASAAGAGNSDRARLYLLTAQDELSQAMKSRGKPADLLLLRSRVDAELAMALTHEEVLEAQATEATQRARTLSSSQPRP
jgi:hypothetical protein